MLKKTKYVLYFISQCSMTALHTNLKQLYGVVTRNAFLLMCVLSWVHECFFGLRPSAALAVCRYTVKKKSPIL